MTLTLSKNQLQRLIRHEICSGHIPTEVFNRAARKFVHASFYEDSFRVERWLENVNDESSNDYPWIFKPILKAIRREFGKINFEQLQERMYPNSLGVCQLSFLDDRYSLDIVAYDNKKKCSLYLIDHFYGHKREIYPVGKAPKYHIATHRLRVLDSNYFCLICRRFKKRFNSYIHYIHLFKFDMKKMEYTKCDEITVSSPFCEILADSSNPYNFLVITRRDGQFRLCKGRLVNSKLELGTSYKMGGAGQTIFGLKFENDLLYNLEFEEETGGTAIIQNKWIFEENECKKHVDIRIFIDADFDYLNECLFLNKSCYTWSGNKFYACMPLNLRIWPEIRGCVTRFFVFDLEKQNLVEMECPDIDRIQDMRVENDVLFLCSVSYFQSMHCWHRFTVREPDSLFNIAVSAIRNNLLFMDDEVCNSMIERLPKIFQPFGGAEFIERKKEKRNFLSKVSKLFRK